MSLKYYSRLKVYKNYNSANYFNPETMEAVSYGWWPYLQKTKLGLVFNNYSYSNQTSKHQGQLRSVLRNLGVEVDLFIEAPRGLGRWDESLAHYYRMRAKVELELSRDRRRKSKDDERWATVDYYNEQIKIIRKLGGTCSRKEIARIYESVADSEDQRLHEHYCNQFEETNIKIELTGDAMVNLKKLGLAFSGVGLDRWGVEVTRAQLNEFLKANELSVHYSGGLKDSWSSTTKLLKDGETWGEVFSYNNYSNEYRKGGL